MPDKPAVMLRRNLDAAGIPYVDSAGRYVDTYALRHTAGTRLSYTVQSLADLQFLMRHKTASMTSRYTHPRIASARAAVDKLKRPSKRLRRREA